MAALGSLAFTLIVLLALGLIVAVFGYQVYAILSESGVLDGR